MKEFVEGHEPPGMRRDLWLELGKEGLGTEERASSDRGQARHPEGEEGEPPALT